MSGDGSSREQARQRPAAGHARRESGCDVAHESTLPACQPQQAPEAPRKQSVLAGQSLSPSWFGCVSRQARHNRSLTCKCTQVTHYPGRGSGAWFDTLERLYKERVTG
eukprot:1551617-Rhodomonas_salina.1